MGSFIFHWRLAKHFPHGKTQNGHLTYPIKKVLPSYRNQSADLHSRATLAFNGLSWLYIKLSYNAKQRSLTPNTFNFACTSNLDICMQKKQSDWRKQRYPTKHLVKALNRHETYLALKSHLFLILLIWISFKLNRSYDCHIV